MQWFNYKTEFIVPERVLVLFKRPYAPELYTPPAPLCFKSILSCACWRANISGMALISFAPVIIFYKVWGNIKSRW